ncbi:GNAT family N-acetyltransferase [Pseudomonas sp. TH49]|uniref:GNAT family N-acetyltransferase n=1 Tax=unclassified Pseudomonas TaxID=196821 RepID=UPI001913A4F4|nr:GNAT family N-acetyltransferase [Pseudomonas sp. 13B_3.2_Bac1]MBK5344132.1 GNAT family N-acetyltransferase [Pseudomonas sp. TH49]MCU1771492.1 GNAT family N-acetyltransferase [Pseudomonas sp. 13B_3.2_Bac1]
MSLNDIGLKIPTLILRSPRLVLRAWSHEDLSSLISMNSEPEVNGLLGGPALVEGSAASILRYRECMAANRWGVFHVADVAGAFLGLAGLQPVRSTLPVAPAVEAVWRFRRAAWGAGYASEAMRLVLDGCCQDVAAGQILAIISQPNIRSAQTATRLGFHHDPKSDFLYPDLALDASLRPHKVFRLDLNPSIQRHQYY